MEQDYYVSRREELMHRFDEDTRYWRPLLVTGHGDRLAEAIIQEARQRFEALIPQLPYIGGDENHLTAELVRSARCLALYEAAKAHGVTAAEIGKVLYEATLARVSAVTLPVQSLSPEELMRRRRDRAARSQQRRYPADWVYALVQGDGEAFDYGYDFVECAAQKLYRAHGAAEFLPYYCFLDFASSKAAGLGLSRTMTLAEGHDQCNHRFKRGRKTEQDWPPPWLRQASDVRLTLMLLAETFAVCRLGPNEEIPPWLSSCAFWSVTHCDDELSVVIPEAEAPATWQAERGWRCLKVQGPLDFSLTGILASIAVPLADGAISIFAISTYDTDYILIRSDDLDKAVGILRRAGHQVEAHY